MTAPRAPFHVPADLDATLHAAICDFRRTTRTTDGTRSEQVIRWAAEIERAAVAGLGETPMSEPLFRRNAASAILRLNRHQPAYPGLRVAMHELNAALDRLSRKKKPSVAA